MPIDYSGCGALKHLQIKIKGITQKKIGENKPVKMQNMLSNEMGHKRFDVKPNLA